MALSPMGARALSTVGARALSTVGARALSTVGARALSTVGARALRQPTPLNDFYTEIFITERGSGEVNQEHEVILIETASRKPVKEETPIRCEELFKPLPGQDKPDKPIRTIMTTGSAGMGKTVLTHKFTLDWAEGKANHNIDFTFLLTFRELNLLKGKELPLDFENNQIWTDVTKSTSVDVLLTNLIRGNLLPSARIWITTRPAAANQIPAECVDMVTEVRGFNDSQKEEYFKKRFKDKNLASTIISHVKESRSLHIMCHIPVFCWITASVLEDFFKTSQMGEKMPNTVTQMYIHFLRVHSESREIISSLGKLAFNQLVKGNLIFYEADLTECDIDIRAASVYSGVFTQIFKEECGLYQDKVFCFVHLSLQEFLAALNVFLLYSDNEVDLLSEEQPTSGENKLLELLQFCVDEALKRENGHLDLFLRFLLGSSQTIKETVSYIKEKLNGDLPPERSINLLHCLNELNDHSLVEEIQQYLTSGSISTESLTPGQWSALMGVPPAPLQELHKEKSPNGKITLREEVRKLKSTAWEVRCIG
uniref:FISNA domain-containing protein n=1 Tax=Gadus morhua TaxID=8049 RepID=A0A8C5CSS6_GADMO